MQIHRLYMVTHDSLGLKVDDLSLFQGTLTQMLYVIDVKDDFITKCVIFITKCVRRFHYLYNASKTITKRFSRREFTCQQNRIRSKPRQCMT